MGVRKVVLPRYLVRCVEFSIAAAVAFGSVTELQAQVDPNLESRIETFTPRFPEQPVPAPKIEREPVFKVRQVPVTERVRRPDAEIEALLAKKHGADKIQTFSATDRIQELKRMGLSEFKTIVTGTRPVKEKVGEIVTIKPPDTKVKAIFPFNPTYESNVLKSNQNIRDDVSAGFGGGFQIQGAGARPLDVVTVSATSASARYSEFPSKSVDTATLLGSYQFFLGAKSAGGGPGDMTKPFVQIVDQLTLGVTNSTAFTPTFHRETADFFTPAITLSRSNIPLFGDTGGSCTTGLNNSPAFCYYANLSLVFGHTFSDQSTLQNSNAALAGTVGWRARNDLTLSFVTKATAKYYETVPGGRQDLILAGGPNLLYLLNDFVTVSVAVTYTQQFSSISQNEWSGVVVQPTITITFPVDSWPAN